MAISLQKGQNVSLSKQAPGLKKVRFGLGWDARATDGAAFDLILRRLCWTPTARC